MSAEVTTRGLDATRRLRPVAATLEAADGLLEATFVELAESLERAAAEELAASLDVDPDRLWAWCRAFAARLAATEAATERRQAFRDMAV